jgi:transcriptional regulator with XRE-family HTH domain
MSPSRKSFPNPRKASSKAGRGSFSKARIKKLEERIGQVNLAKMLGVSTRSIRRYKEGTREPRADIYYKLRRVERAGKGIRKTKSIKRKKARAEKITREHPEIRYFEKRESYSAAETDHVIITDVHVEDIDGLISYLSDEGCESAFFVVSGIDSKGNEQFYSTEVMVLDNFSKNWERLLQEILDRYDFTLQKLDLVGIKYHAQTPQKGQEKLLFNA